ncbi:MAG: hypothetical protein ACXW2I_09065 [Burkholderiales bacterium]
MSSAYKAIVCALLVAFSTSLFAAQKEARRAPPAKKETHACRLGTEDRHARIAVVLVGGKMNEFAYYSKWKPRTCSIYLQRDDAHSKWADKGNVTTVNVERGVFLIEHKPGQYQIAFKDVDRERYCGMDGTINGTLTIRKGNTSCELEGIMEEGTPLGHVHVHMEQAPPALLQDAQPGAAPAPAPTAVEPEQQRTEAPAAVTARSAQAGAGAE